VRAGDKLPKCQDCGARTDRVVTERATLVEVRAFFLCASCEYLRIHPDAERFVPPPRGRSPKGLQKEVLFP
jgi:hypothetical protein